jgi:hypothetical protein
VGLSFLGCRRFYDGDQAQTDRVNVKYGLSKTSISNMVKPFCVARGSSTTFDKEPTSIYLYSPLHAGLVQFVSQSGIYEGHDARMAYVDHFLCSTEELREKAADYEAGLWFMYEEE